ncbi:MAG: hypothetical protein LIP02_06225 [Bacteroidales bacterium]|nr:hypothetical protein [Bacteroidales bacterium]
MQLTLYDANVTEPVTNEKGDSETINQQEQGTGISYTGEKENSNSGALVSNDKGTNTDATITLTQSNGVITMVVRTSAGTDTYTIGTGEYTDLSTTLDAIGYYVTNDTTYTLLWTVEDVRWRGTAPRSIPTPPR